MPGAQREERGARGLGARLGAELGRKVGVLLGLAVGICVPYFSIQRLALFPPRDVPVTALDAWIAFRPDWILPYLSIALMVPLAPLLATRRVELVRYAWGLAMLCLPCFVVFLLYPVQGPRPPLAVEHAVYAWVVATDAPSNSLPSLHAGLVVYSLLFAHRVLRDDLDPRGRAVCAALGAVWGALILYSTLAVKQHWVVDLPAGIVLAGAAHALAWRSADRLRAGGKLPATAG